MPKNFVKKAFHPFKEQRIPILNNYSRAEEKTKKKKVLARKIQSHVLENTTNGT